MQPSVYFAAACVQDKFACEIYEEIIRYHIMCEHELCESEASVLDPEGFSSHLSVEQLNKVASSLAARAATKFARIEPVCRMQKTACKSS